MEEVNKNNAGFYLTKKIPIFLETLPVFKIIESFQSNIKNFDNLDYVYIVNKEGVFKGLIPFDKLYNSNKSKIVSEICQKCVKVSVTLNDNKNQAIYLSLKYDISCVPVIDNKGRLVGAIEDTKILQILHKKHIDDRFHSSGISKSHNEIDSIFDISIFNSVKHRFFWLLMGLFGGLLAAEIIGFFESTLEKYIILAAFIPLVVYIADAVGTQLEAFSIRDFVLFKKMNFLKYFFRQLSTVFIISILLGISSAIISYIMYNNIQVSIILGISIIIATLSSVITGLIIPFLFRKLKKDPANGSGPIGTIIQDLLSVIVYFVVAKLFLI